MDSGGAGHVLIRGDAGRIPLADRSVHCIVTSPPFYGLRDYGTGRWEGGEPGCEHRKDERPRSTRPLGPFHGNSDENDTQYHVYRDNCRKCGARRVDRQIGLEESPDQFVARLVEVFREARRVLRDDGVMFLNLGDSYGAGSRAGQVKETNRNGKVPGQGDLGRVAGFSKQLLGIPWRVALALQADGWYLRMDIVWNKPNPMPESVTDRPTKSHEYVFMMTKRERYYYDADAVREPMAEASADRYAYGFGGAKNMALADANRDGVGCRTRVIGEREPASGRNRRSVWTIATKSFRGAHFAVFPPALVEPCIRAGTSERGCCPACGAPWGRVVERPYVGASQTINGRGDSRMSCPSGKAIGSDTRGMASYKGTTLGWSPTCSCDGTFVEEDAPEDWMSREGVLRARVRRFVPGPNGVRPPVPCTVLDPFVGSGTTVLVANALGRRGIGLDLSATYLRMARRRVTRPHAPVAKGAQSEDGDSQYPLFVGGS